MAGRVRKRTNVKSKYGSGRAGGQRRGAAMKKQAEARKVRDARLNPGGDLYKETIASGNRPEYKSSKMKGKAYSTSKDAAKIRQWNNDREKYLLQQSSIKLEADKKEAARLQREAQAERQRVAAEDRRRQQEEYRNEVVGMRTGAAESENRYRSENAETLVGGMEGGDTARDNNMRNVRRRRNAANARKASAELKGIVKGEGVDKKTRRRSVFDRGRRTLLGRGRKRGKDGSNENLGYGG